MIKKHVFFLMLCIIITDTIGISQCAKNRIKKGILMTLAAAGGAAYVSRDFITRQYLNELRDNFSSSTAFAWNFDENSFSWSKPPLIVEKIECTYSDQTGVEPPSIATRNSRTVGCVMGMGCFYTLEECTHAEEFEKNFNIADAGTILANIKNICIALALPYLIYKYY